MEPVTVNCSGACTVTHVVTLDLPPFTLSTEDATLLAGAILAVWAIGFAFRMLIRVLRDTDGSSSTSTTESD